MKSLRPCLLIAITILCSLSVSFSQNQNTASTFVLSNESPGYLIDELIEAGYGASSLYEVMQAIKPYSGGVITDEFMAKLAACPTGSEIFTATLSNFGGLNNPVGVNSDGTVMICSIYGRDYVDYTGFSIYPLSVKGYVREYFTYAKSEEYYIDTGHRIKGSDTENYKAFAIAWGMAAAPTTIVLTNEGGLIDSLIAGGYGEGNLYQTAVSLAPASGGVINEEFMEKLANCPSGSEIFTAKLKNYAGINNPVGINADGTLIITAVFGKDYYQNKNFKTYPNIYKVEAGRELFTYALSPEGYIDTGSSIDNGTDTVNYKAFAIAWAMTNPPTTFVLSNEGPGDLIDKLIAGGYGDSNLYETLVALEPVSGGVISEDFLNQLASCPAESEIFTAKLKVFSGLNNPVCINNDGTLGIQPIYAKDLHGKNGYSTYPEIVGAREYFTYATSPDYYVHAGEKEGEITKHYQAFAIAWEDTSVLGVDDNFPNNTKIIISPNPASEYIEINLDTINPTLKRGVDEGAEEIKIYNTFGENVINYELRITNYDEMVRIDVSQLPNGMYFLNCGGNVKSFIISK